MPPIAIPYTLAPGAHAPTRATPGAAGLDLCAHLSDGRVSIPPGEWAHIPTGVHLALPAGYEGQVRPRSGLAWKRGVAVLNAPGTIDSDFRGEVGVLLVNHGDEDFAVEHGDRIAQLVVCPVPAVELVPADSLPATERGAGGFGSTGTGPATVPVTLTRRSPDAARAYHEGHASAMRSVAGWLREKADASENIAAQHGVVGGWLGDCATGSDDDRAPAAASAPATVPPYPSGVWEYDYRAGGYVFTGPPDEALREMAARIRHLEAAVLEARAERDKWAAELDALRGTAQSLRDDLHDARATCAAHGLVSR